MRSKNSFKIGVPDSNTTIETDTSIKSIAKNNTDDRLPPTTSSALTYGIQILHALYAIAITAIIATSNILPMNWNSLNWIHLVWCTTAICLVIDNIRFTLGLFSPSSFPLIIAVHHITSRLCYLTHEALTPYALLFIPYILFQSPHIYTPITVHTTWGFFLASSLLLSQLGLIRYLAFTDWSVTTTFGVTVCRPAHSSKAALIPIFMTVAGLISISVYLMYTAYTLQYRVLLVGQVIVFVGNGAIGPNKQLLALFGNAFEVLWLWSIGQALAV